MDFKEFQDWVLNYYKERGWTDDGPFIRPNFLTEEVGELTRAIRSPSKL